MTPQGQISGLAFRLSRRFSASPEKVFEAWTNPEALKRWWCPAGWVPAGIEINLRPGGAYRIGMRRSSGDKIVHVSGVFSEVDRPRKLVYTWNWENAYEEMPETRVSVEFLDDCGSTELILIHQQLPEIQVCLIHRAGWIASGKRLDLILGNALGSSPLTRGESEREARLGFQAPIAGVL